MSIFAIYQTPTYTITPSLVTVVDLRDHPAIRGVRLHGSLTLIDRCASLTIENATVTECTEPCVPKEMIVDVTVPFVCQPEDCSVAILAKGDIRGDLSLEVLENTVFLPVVEMEGQK